MARPKKFRKVCCEPKYTKFAPKIEENTEKEEKDTVVMTVEEFEVIRLIDFRNMEQIETAEKMEIARSTVQRIYKDAREKIADMLINGKTLKIQGGQYRLCEDYFIVEECPDCPEQIKHKSRNKRKQ